MLRPTRSDLIQEMARLGEEAPKVWTIPEIQSRLDELYEEKGLMRTRGKTLTPLRHYMVEINRYSKRKADLQNYLQQHMMIPLTGNETISDLQKKGIKKAYETTQGMGEDPVGFGEHSSLQYSELLVTQPKYADWVMRTAQEGQCDYRLRRLAEWLQENKGKPQVMPNDTKVIKKKSANPKAGEENAVSSGSKNMSGLEETQFQIMQQMANMLQHLKEEVETIKEERPHKKTLEMPASEADSSMGSFSEVNMA